MQSPRHLLRLLTGQTRRGAPGNIKALAAGLVLVGLSFVAIQTWSLWNARGIQLAEAQVATSNMAKALAQHASDTIQAADIALVGVVQQLEFDNLAPDALTEVQALLRLSAAQLPSLHGLFVYDSSGRGLATSQAEHQPDLNHADREFFKHHAANPTRDTYVGLPITSRTNGHWIVPVSRRINHSDGRFAGVALATIEMSFFQKFHDSFDIGKAGVILLMREDGKLMSKRPFSAPLLGGDIGASAVYRAYQSINAEGSHVTTSIADGIERMYSYRHIGPYPLVASSGLATSEVLADWWKDSLRMLGVMGVLLTILGMLARRLMRQIALREQAEADLRDAKADLESTNQALERLSLQDSLTELGNRRRFDTALKTEFGRATRNGNALSLVMVDVDHFKRYNDVYGHPAGDACLRQIGIALGKASARPTDVAARYGGEEFALLLPDTDSAGAVSIGERFRQTVQELAIPHAGNPGGVVTVSVGVATCQRGQHGLPHESLLLAADKALYAAKAGGRNQVSSAA